jgi:riboflavin kinase/FMN adenylyltransferase
MPTHWIDWHQTPPDVCRGGVVTIGNFDGVHRGHGALLLQVILQGRAVPCPSVVLTFDPHPLELLRPQAVPPRLTTVEDRAEVLHGMGVEHVVILRTAPDMLALEPDAFFETVIVRGLQARALVEGDNFAFGRNRAGNIHRLAELCHNHGLALTTIPQQDHDAEELSSSAIRAALLAGDVTRAAHQLGRPYRLRGIVTTGAQRGRTLGFPTANLTAIPTLIPRDGVYAVRGIVAGKAWPGAANVGPNPTFGEGARKVEIHLLDFSGDLYGSSLPVEFIARLRDTRPFASVQELLAQLQQDIAQARTLVSEGATP